MKLRAVLCATLLFFPSATSALEGITPGVALPPFSLADLSGNRFTEKHFEGSGGVVIFWSTWSPRSTEILEDFLTYQRAYADRGLKVVAINAEKEGLSAVDRQAVQTFARGMNLSFPVLLDSSLETYAAYGVMALPSAVVVDGRGRVTYSLGGYPLTYREELKESVLLAMGLSGNAGPPAFAAVPVPGDDGEVPPSVKPERTAVCTVPRARYCSLSAERYSSSSPGVIAVRLSICRGDTDEAVKMLRGIDSENLRNNDLRFALGNLMLLKGRSKEAARVFTALKERSPNEGWGAWGLGLIALAEGDASEAARLMGEGSTAHPGNLEAETAALKYLEKYWLLRKSAPEEESFLSLFSTLTNIRDCYRDLTRTGGKAG